MLRIVREHIVATGMCTLALLFVGALLFDGAVFYADVVRSRAPITANEKKANLSEQEVIDTLKLVDDRQKEFDEILGNVSKPVNATSSIKIK